MPKLLERAKNWWISFGVWSKLLQAIGAAIALASLIPIYEVSKAGLDYVKRNHIRTETLAYARHLSGAGHHERATKVVSNLDSVSNYDANSQFHISLIAARASLYTSGDYQDVEDGINLLINIVERDPLRVFTRTRTEQLLELQILLNEVRIQRGAFSEVLSAVDEIRKGRNEVVSSYEKTLLLQEGIALVHTHRREEGEQLLQVLISDGAGSPGNLARAQHAYGTSLVINGDLQEGHAYLLDALNGFSLLEDDFRQVRTLANLVIRPLAERDWETARFFWLQQEALARRIEDSVGLNNALIGLSNAARNRGAYHAALAYAEEAQRMAETDGNTKLLASSLQTIANVSFRMGDHSRALETAKTALPYFAAERDIRGMRTSLGIQGQAAEEIRDFEEAVFAYFGAIGCIDAASSSENLAQQRDRSIYYSSLEDILAEMEKEKLEELATKTELLLSSVFLVCPKPFDLEDVPVNAE